MSRDVRLAYKLWLLTRTDFAWNAFTELLWDDASATLRKRVQKGLYRGTRLDETKRRKLTFVIAYETMQQLDRQLSNVGQKSAT